MNKNLLWLIGGDALTLLLVTIYGFASHNELGSGGSRMLTTFIPLLLAWLLIAPHLGVYDLERIQDPRQLWRPFWAMVLAGPMAGWLRGVMLGQPILPVFVLVIGGVSALALLFWRSVYGFAVTRMRWLHG
jgi:Protein of unknown function (DUF3054)